MKGIMIMSSFNTVEKLYKEITPDEKFWLTFCEKTLPYILWEGMLQFAEL